MPIKTTPDSSKLIEQIYIQHKDRLYNYILRLCHDKHLAQDIMQHTFYKVLSNPEITKVKHLKAYLFTIAHNKLKDEWKRKPTVPFEGDDTMQDTPDFRAEVTPEKKATADASNTSVEKTIRQMPENFSELMLLRYTEDLSITEIAEITNRSVTDIKVSLHRARLKFESLHTASMYSKIAVSRNRCETVRELLYPFHDDDLSKDQLTSINKHIIKCNICAKDAEEMKRTRQLFVALPLIPFPLAFDEFSKQLPQLSSTTTATELPSSEEVGSTQSAVGATAGSSANSEVITQTIGQTVRIKIAAGVVGATLLAGSGFYFIGQGDISVPSAKADKKNINEQIDPKAKEPIVKNTGEITLVAKLSQGSQKKLKNVKWKLEPLSRDPLAKEQSQKPIGAPSKKTGDEITYTLLPGTYKVIASLDGLKKSEVINVEKGKSSISPIIFDAGEINVTMPPNKDFDTSDVQWHLYKGTASDPIATFFGNFSKYLFAGKYVLRASYRGHLEKRHEIILAPGQIAPVAKPGFSYGKLELQAKLGKSGKTLGSEKSTQWSVDYLVNGKVDESNVIKIDTETSEILLSPGNYRVNLSLGKHISQSSDIVIREGKTNKNTGLVLDAGKLVLQAKITLDAPLLPAYVNWKVDRLSANNKKINIATSSTQNSVSYYLPPGKYRVTAIYGENLTVVRTVTVKTGETVINSNFKFDPGAADFTAIDFRSKQSISTALNWLLEQQTAKGSNTYVQLKRVKTSRAIFALLPGHYRITAEHGKHGKRVKEFDIVSGKVTKDILVLSSTSQAPRWEWK